MVDKGTVLRLDRLPFAACDATAGVENEFQVAVKGAAQDVDLPRWIESSAYYTNLLKRIERGELPPEKGQVLNRLLQTGREEIWVNSWVRFPFTLLSAEARRLLEEDLQSDKRNPALGLRSDHHRFLQRDGRGETVVRVPISYLLKLALADVMGTSPFWPKTLSRTGKSLLNHFSNDNTSPEITSFYLSSVTTTDELGQAVARETALRFLLTQLLVSYANDRFGLSDSGQEALLYAAPTTPNRQQELNSAISDSFYRELFMNPCLSGWDRGEEKQRYMQLCHEVLSRSQLNTIGELREAGILTNDLVRLPRISNTSLANNGTHISLGSTMLTGFRAAGVRTFSAAEEKNLGDLVIKIVEHFLPLFVGTLSAAPYRIPYTAFRPETVLGFLAHELDHTHLRMLWRRWQKKSDLRILGQTVSPFGPLLLDRFLERMFRLKGDFVPDFRLIDYFAALLSTDQCAAFDGSLGSADRLKRELEQQGVFDHRMGFYCLYRMREYDKSGYFGFEGRHHSLFPSLRTDLAQAVNLQLLITALAVKYIAEGRVSHEDIPDIPRVESERRQVFFDSAIGIPTFFVKQHTPNKLLRRIVARAAGVRQSRRYPGYLRVQNTEYRRALVEVIQSDGPDLIEHFDCANTIQDIRQRIDNPDTYGAAGRLLEPILSRAGAKSALDLPATEFNMQAETSYRVDVRKRYLEEGLDCLTECVQAMSSSSLCAETRRACGLLVEQQRILDKVNASRFAIVSGQASPALVRDTIVLLLLVITAEKSRSSESASIPAETACG